MIGRTYRGGRRNRTTKTGALLSLHIQLDIMTGMYDPTNNVEQQSRSMVIASQGCLPAKRKPPSVRDHKAGIRNCRSVSCRMNRQGAKERGQYHEREVILGRYSIGNGRKNERTERYGSEVNVPPLPRVPEIRGEPERHGPGTCEEYAEIPRHSDARRNRRDKGA